MRRRLRRIPWPPRWAELRAPPDAAPACCVAARLGHRAGARVAAAPGTGLAAARARCGVPEGAGRPWVVSRAMRVEVL